MADPLWGLNGAVTAGNKVYMRAAAGQIQRRDGLQTAFHIVGTYRPSIWFEPDWQQGKLLAHAFPYCRVCSVPLESCTLNLKKVPGWRPRRDFGRV